MEEFERAWDNPIGMMDPAAIFKPGDRTVFVVTDRTRPTPTRKIFPLLWERIGDGFRAVVMPHAADTFPILPVG